MKMIWIYGDYKEPDIVIYENRIRIVYQDTNEGSRSVYLIRTGTIDDIQTLNLFSILLANMDILLKCETDKDVKNLEHTGPFSLKSFINIYSELYGSIVWELWHTSRQGVLKNPDIHIASLSKYYPIVITIPRLRLYTKVNDRSCNFIWLNPKCEYRFLQKTAKEWLRPPRYV